MAQTRAQLNRKVRQEALREQLESQGHLQHVVDNLTKMAELDTSSDFFKNDLDKLKTINDTKLKLIGKYCPDLKAVEIEGDVDSTLTIVRKEYKPSS